MCFLYQSKCGWEGTSEERGRGKGYRSARQQEHLQKQPSPGGAARENLTKESDLQLREAWAAHGRQSWAALGGEEGGGDEGKRDGKGGKGRGRGRGAVPSN